MLMANATVVCKVSTSLALLGENPVVIYIQEMYSTHSHLLDNSFISSNLHPKPYCTRNSHSCLVRYVEIVQM